MKAANLKVCSPEVVFVMRGLPVSVLNCIAFVCHEPSSTQLGFLSFQIFSHATFYRLHTQVLSPATAARSLVE